jgi:hypothetical protein
MRRLAGRSAFVLAVVIATGFGSYALAGDGERNFREELSGYQEIPQTLSTTGNGRFEARIESGSEEIRWELRYADLEASVTQAHIHFGDRPTAGGISVFLCTNLGNGPAGTQACPAAPATIDGTIRPADVIGPAGQGISAGEFAELVAAIRAGVTYANVHTTKYPAGEIRAQLGSKRRDD